MDITEILLSAQSSDGRIQTSAKEKLKQFSKQNLLKFLLCLSVELSDDQKPLESRTFAGIILKDSLDIKEHSKKEELLGQWVNAHPSMKAHLKKCLLLALESSVSEAGHASSQIIAKVASIDIARGEWKDLISQLLLKITRQDAPASLKQVTLETLGNVMNEISSQDLCQEQVDGILTSLFSCMTQTEHSSEVCLSAIKSLHKALRFSQSNFKNKEEMDHIMDILYKTATTKILEIKLAALECLVSISSMYYDVLGPYMQALSNLMANAIKQDEKPVALQAVEFWSSICCEEIKLQEECEGENQHFHFIQKALTLLVPMLLETLSKQEDDQYQNDGTWNLCVAGGFCLTLVARAVGDAIVPLVMPFVQNNISKPDWHSREAAIFALGSIVEEISLEKLLELLCADQEILLNAMQDESSHVKNAAAWCLSNIFYVIQLSGSPQPVTPAVIPHIMSTLLEWIGDSTSAAEEVFETIYVLAKIFKDAQSDLALLSPILGNIISALLCASEGMDIDNYRLRASAYRALNEIVRLSKIPETSDMIANLLGVIMDRVRQTAKLEIMSSDNKINQSGLQALLCPVLRAIIEKLSGYSETKPIILQNADTIMLLLLEVFSCHNTVVQEDAMLSAGLVAGATGLGFAKYMPGFYIYLDAGLQDQESRACYMSVGVAADICDVLGVNVLPYCEPIMLNLFSNLSNPTLHCLVKPQIFHCFGRIALAIGEHFEKYILHVMVVLQRHADLCSSLDGADEDVLHYGKWLRRCILLAYTDIIEGLGYVKPELISPYAGRMLQFIEAMFRDNDMVCGLVCREEEAAVEAVSLMGTLADALGNTIKILFRGRAFYKDLLRMSVQSSSHELKEAATWAQEMIGRVMAL